MRHELLYDIHYELTRFLSIAGRFPGFSNKDVNPVMFKWENELVEEMSKLYGRAGVRFLERLQSLGRIPSDTVVSGIFEEEIVPSFENVRDHLSEVAPEIALDGRDIAKRDLGKLGIEVQTDGFTRTARTRISDSSFRGTTIVMENQKTEVMNLLQTGQNSSLSIRELVDEMRGVVELEDWQMRRIAVTEIGADLNEGIFETSVEMGIEYNQWLTLQDDRVRDSHRLLHSQVVKIQERFSNGLRFPGDRSGALEEFINCRCRSRPYIPKPGEATQGTPFSGS
jgi:hypothetical protein